MLFKKFLGTKKHDEMMTNTLGRGKPSWTEERDWPCKRCGKSIKGISEFVEHLDTFHPNQCGIVCPICDKELPSKRRLKIHVVIHSDKKATCPVSKYISNKNKWIWIYRFNQNKPSSLWHMYVLNEFLTADRSCTTKYVWKNSYKRL